MFIYLFRVCEKKIAGNLIGWFQVKPTLFVVALDGTAVVSNVKNVVRQKVVFRLF